MERTNKVIRIFAISVFLLLLFTVLFSSTAAAQGLRFQIPNPFNQQNVNLQMVIAWIINVAFIAAGLVAVVYLIIGGFRYVTSGGNAEQIEGAKATILNAIIGLIVIFISFLLVNYVLSALHINGSIFAPQTTSGSGSGSGVG